MWVFNMLNTCWIDRKSGSAGYAEPLMNGWKRSAPVYAFGRLFVVELLLLARSQIFKRE